MSLSDVVKKDSKARSSLDKPSDRLKAAGYDPDTWTIEPWKHMQRKEIPTRYDDQLEEALYEESEQGRGNKAAESNPQTAKQAGVLQLKGQKVDAGSVRMTELADANADVSTGSSKAGRQQGTKGSKATRNADEDDDEGDRHEQDSDEGVIGRLGKASKGSSLERSKSDAGSSDSREAAVPREQGAGQRAEKGSSGYEDEDRGSRKSGPAGIAQGSQLDDERGAASELRQKRMRSTADRKTQDDIPGRRQSGRDGEDEDIVEDIEETQDAGRRTRHGQRPTVSGNRGGNVSGAQDRDSLQAAAEEEGRESSSSSARGKADAASEPQTSSSSTTKSSAGSGVSGVAAGDSRREKSGRKEKAAPAVRPALKGYNLSWTVQETEQEVNAELLSDDPTRWSWQPTTPDQPGGLLMNDWPMPARLQKTPHLTFNNAGISSAFGTCRA